MDGQKEFVQIDHNDLYPYLLVHVGSGVGMYKVVIIILVTKHVNFFKHFR